MIYEKLLCLGIKSLECTSQKEEVFRVKIVNNFRSTLEQSTDILLKTGYTDVLQNYVMHSKKKRSNLKEAEIIVRREFLRVRLVGSILEEEPGYASGKCVLLVQGNPWLDYIKNYALSMTKLSYPIFILAVIVHGFPFSFLWAAVGNDANLRLRTLEMGETMAANAVLNWSVIFVFIFGFVISPSVTGWWLADLRQEKVG